MIPRIEIAPQKKLVGLSMQMSLSDNKTGQLWKSFMPRRKEIQNVIGTGVYSMQVYDCLYFDNFNPNTEFEKRAVVEVTNFNAVPDGMKTFVLPSGLYAVFIHKGSSVDLSLFQYIFAKWLPESDFLLDDRPHFEWLGEKYKNDDTNSEEEIWIPIKPQK